MRSNQVAEAVVGVSAPRHEVVHPALASPRLFEPECRTPQQMRLANALCRYRELAREA